MKIRSVGAELLRTNFMKILSVGAELLRTNGQEKGRKDRHGEVNSNF
jgi:hypothetical protein